MINFKLGEIKDIANAFNTIINNEISMQLSWQLSEILFEIIEKEKLYNHKHQEIVERCAEKDDKGQIIFTEDKKGVKIQKDKIEKYTNLIKELNDINISLDESPILLKDLIKEEIKISPVNLYILRNFITKEYDNCN